MMVVEAFLCLTQQPSSCALRKWTKQRERNGSQPVMSANKRFENAALMEVLSTVKQDEEGEAGENTIIVLGCLAGPSPCLETLSVSLFCYDRKDRCTPSCFFS